eukprot:8042354-Pyramimonas_sp.AAC.1
MRHRCRIVSINVSLVNDALVHKRPDSLSVARTVGACEVYSVVSFIRKIAQFSIDEWREAEMGGVEGAGGRLTRVS